MKPLASIPRKEKRRERSVLYHRAKRKPHYLALLIRNLSKWSEVLCYNTIKSSLSSAAEERRNHQPKRD